MTSKSTRTLFRVIVILLITFLIAEIFLITRSRDALLKQYQNVQAENIKLQQDLDVCEARR